MQRYEKNVYLCTLIKHRSKSYYCIIKITML